MRQISMAAFAVLLASTAIAQGRESDAAPILLTSTYNRCQAVSEIPHSSRTAEPVLLARVSTASCMADAKLADLPLTDSQASIERVNEAIAPMMATLDAVIEQGDAYAQLVAAYTKGDLLFGLQQRLRDAVPSMNEQMSLAAIQDIEARHRALEPKLSPWRREGNTAFLRVIAVGQANPRLTKDNPVVLYMIRDAERRLPRLP